MAECIDQAITVNGFELHLTQLSQNENSEIL